MLVFQLLGCGGGVGGFSGNTSVTLLATSEANDQLVQFSVGISSLTLTNQSGDTVNLTTAPIAPEFIHVNGTAEPLVTVGIPQGVYTAATITVGGAQFACATLDPTTGGLDNSTFSYGQVPKSNVAITLPAPITVTGEAMGLSLDLLVSKSETLSACLTPGGSSSYTITPTFSVTPVTYAQTPTSVANGKLNGLAGMIASVDNAGSEFTLKASDGPAWTVATNSGTTFAGVSGAGQLAAGTSADMDVAIQTDGSLLATRVQVEDTNPSDLSVWNGPVESVNTIIPVLGSGARAEYGYLYADAYVLDGSTFSFGSATFQVAGGYSNLPSLPFSASFTAANMVAGQNVNISTHATSLAEAYPTYMPASTVTLLPQTIDGTVEGISADGGFTVYAVSLAAYDLFPMLAVQQGQTTLLNSPSTVMVYANGNTQMLNTAAPAVGGILRFNGLVFDDNGTLRMDCAQVNDGVAE